MISRLSLLAIVVVVVHSQIVSSQDDDCNSGFKQGAEAFVQVQYRSKNRKGSIKQIVTEAEVLWQPQDMLANPKCYDLQQTTLMYKPVSLTYTKFGL